MSSVTTLGNRIYARSDPSPNCLQRDVKPMVCGLGLSSVHRPLPFDFEGSVCWRLIFLQLKPEIKLGATVRLWVHSGEIISGQVVHIGEEKSVQMVRVPSGQLVYKVPARMLVDDRKSK